MKNVAMFEKVSVKEFETSLLMYSWDNFSSTERQKLHPKEIMQNLKLPVRSTAGSAGYDFFSPIPFQLYPRDHITIPSGIKCEILKPEWYLAIFTKSGLGFKYHVRLADTVGVIDADYYNNEKNEGDIIIKIINGSNDILKIEAGQKICQGVFMEYGLTIDDKPTSKTRTGGMGSTGK